MVSLPETPACSQTRSRVCFSFSGLKAVTSIPLRDRHMPALRFEGKRNSMGDNHVAARRSNLLNGIGVKLKSPLEGNLHPEPGTWNHLNPPQAFAKATACKANPSQEGNQIRCVPYPCSRPHALSPGTSWQKAVGNIGSRLTTHDARLNALRFTLYALRPYILHRKLYPLPFNIHRKDLHHHMLMKLYNC